MFLDTRSQSVNRSVLIVNSLKYFSVERDDDFVLKLIGAFKVKVNGNPGNNRDKMCGSHSHWLTHISTGRLSVPHSLQNLPFGY